MHTSRRDAFRSVNQLPLGSVSVEGDVQLSSVARPRASGEAAADTAMEEAVGLVHFYPGLSAETLRATLEPLKGLVIAGTGLGHVAEDLVPVLGEAVDAGKIVVMASQCHYGRVDLYVYETGRDLVKAGVLSAEDMLPETAYVKLMWVLGHTSDPEDVARLLAEDRVGELNPSLRVGEDLSFEG